MTNIRFFDRPCPRRTRAGKAPEQASGPADHVRLLPIFEVVLRVTSDLAHPAAMTAWRGLSGRRYVASVQPLAEVEIDTVAFGMAIAVRRSPDGIARAMDVMALSRANVPGEAASWLARMRTRGASELHVHRLDERKSERDSERRAVLADLGGGIVGRQVSSAARSPERLSAMAPRIGSLTPISSSLACVERT